LGAFFLRYCLLGSVEVRCESYRARISNLTCDVGELELELNAYPALTCTLKNTHRKMSAHQLTLIGVKRFNQEALGTT
jgi:hypothetical protein